MAKLIEQEEENDKRIDHIVNALIKLAAGELSFRIDLSGQGDAIDAIATGINILVEEIQSSQEIVKQAQEVLQKNNQDLEERVRQRTEELFIAKRKAEQANQYKSNFLASMSHEIRTPLNGVLGMLDLLASSSVDEEQQKCITTAQHSAKVLLTVINDVLNLSKIEANKIILEQIEFNLWQLIEETVDGFACQAVSKNLELNVFIEESIPEYVVGDPIRLQQIMNNLISNALKFTERGEVYIKAILAGSVGDRAKIAIEVSDTGIGIDEDKQKNLFHPFTQADQSTTRKFGGTGLGLAIAQKLVRLMNGYIDLSSNPGVGSSFRMVFELPFDKRVHSQPKLQQERRRILVVDGSERQRTILGNYLQSMGVREITTCTNIDVWEIVASDKISNFDLCIFFSDHICDSQKEHLQKELFNRVPVLCVCNPNQKNHTVSEISYPRILLPIRRVELSKMFNRVFGDGSLLDASHVDDVTKLERPSRRYNILVVDDNYTNILVAKGMLKKLNYFCEFVSNGKEAIEIMETQEFDLVLMDCEMPILDGYEATQMIRRKGIETSDGPIPVVALTAHAMESDRQKCLAAGMNDILFKPLSLNGLNTVLSKWLGK